MRDLTSLRPWVEELLAPFPEEILYGFADLTGLVPQHLAARPRAVAFAVRMPEGLMDSVILGPNDPYFAEYNRVNGLINQVGEAIAAGLRSGGAQAGHIEASGRIDPESIRAEFPHKTAAIHAGLGWIGKNCQLVTRPFGPRVRLGTVLTDAPLGQSAPRAADRSFCGSCVTCVKACPAKALTGMTWQPGMARELLFNARLCSQWKAEHYPEYKGSVCGICTAVCPVGTVRHKERKQKETGSR